MGVGVIVRAKARVSVVSRVGYEQKMGFGVRL